MNEDKTRSPYHHGNARNAILQAASDLLESSGAAGLSLRQVAERAGLSRGAPYNHFNDKSGLLAELIVNGFSLLNNLMLAAQLKGESPEDQLRLACLAYITFAQTSPALFRLMFASELVDAESYPGVSEGQDAALDVVRTIVTRIVHVDEAADLTLTAWTMVHGYATLCNEAKLETSEMREDRAALFARIIASAAR